MFFFCLKTEIFIVGKARSPSNKHKQNWMTVENFLKEFFHFSIMKIDETREYVKIYNTNKTNIQMIICLVSLVCKQILLFCFLVLVLGVIIFSLDRKIWSRKWILWLSFIHFAKWCNKQQNDIVVVVVEKQDKWCLFKPLSLSLSLGMKVIFF